LLDSLLQEMIKKLLLLLSIFLACLAVYISRHYVLLRPRVGDPPPLRKYKVSKEQLNQLHRDGAVLLPGVLDPAWLDYMTRVVEDRVANPYLGSLPSRLLGVYTYHQFDNWIASAGFLDYLTLGPAASIALQVQPSWKTLRVLKESLFYQPRAEFPALLSPLHVDIESGGEYANFPTFRLWVPLDPVPKGRGVVFQRGTHGNPRAREEEFNMRSCPEAANHSRYLAWDMQPGDGLVWFGDTAHFAYGGDRRVVSTSLIEGSTSVFEEDKKPHLSWDWYDHRLKHGDIIQGPYFPQVYPELLPEETKAREDGQVQYFSGPVFSQMVPMMLKVLKFFGGSPQSRCQYDVPFTS